MHKAGLIDSSLCTTIWFFDKVTNPFNGHFIHHDFTLSQMIDQSIAID